MGIHGNLKLEGGVVGWEARTHVARVLRYLVFISLSSLILLLPLLCPFVGVAYTLCKL